jgi:hypothetical protein
MRIIDSHRGASISSFVGTVLRHEVSLQLVQTWKGECGVHCVAGGSEGRGLGICGIGLEVFLAALRDGSGLGSVWDVDDAVEKAEVLGFFGEIAVVRLRSAVGTVFVYVGHCNERVAWRPQCFVDGNRSLAEG